MGKYNGVESEALEFKAAYTDSICREIVSFLNAEGGDIVLGVDNDGNIVGVSKLDEISRKISDVITTQIEPNPQELVSSEMRYAEGKTLLVIHVPKGTRPIYCQKKYGFSSTGCTIRIGTTCKEMSPEQIKARYERNFTDTDFLTITPARYGAISFRTLKICYSEKGYHLDEKSFEQNLGLRTPKGEYNLLAELLSDRNMVPLIVVKFHGKDKSSISERNDYGGQSLLFAYEQVKNRLISENICISDTTSRPRTDRFLFDFDCVNEAFINALVHNDWNLSQPLVSIFEDRIEILSHGGLPRGQTEEMFFQGISRPRNDMMMRIFMQMELTEHTGHGIPVIVSKYGKEVFHIGDSYINVVIPFDADVAANKRPIVGQNVRISKTEKQVLQRLLEKPNATAEALAAELSLSVRTIQRALHNLQDRDIIRRTGNKRSGAWLVVKSE